MPPVPPVRRQAPAAVASVPKPVSLKHHRFLQLLCAHPDHPAQGIGQQRYEALPQPCREALVTVTTAMPYLDAIGQAVLEAYYGSGHRPDMAPTGLRWEADLSRATAMMEAPGGDIAAFLSMFPALSDASAILRMSIMISAPELKAGEKIRLEALRLLLQLKGHLSEEQGAAVQATQIVIHTSQEPIVTAKNEPKVIEIEL